jgi:hypothetical protein
MKIPKPDYFLGVGEKYHRAMTKQIDGYDNLDCKTIKFYSVAKSFKS